MKKAIFIFTLVLVSFCAFSQTQRAHINFTKGEHDFGEINEKDGTVSTTFEFINTGGEPLILGQVKASCGCTTPTWTKTPVLPGGKGFVKAVYDPINRPGNFSKSITVNSNADNSPFKLRIKGNVIPRDKTIEDSFPYRMGNLRVSTNNIAFAQIYKGKITKKTIEVVNMGSEDITIAFDKVPPHITVTAEPQKLVPNGKGKILLTYDSKTKNDWGYLVDRFYLSTNGKLEGANRFSVFATIVEDFRKLSENDKALAAGISFKKTRHDFGNIKKGETVEHKFEFTNTGKSNLIIRKTKASCGCTAVNMEKNIIKPGEKGWIKAVFDSKGRSGKQRKSISVIVNDPQSPSHTLWIEGEIE